MRRIDVHIDRLSVAEGVQLTQLFPSSRSEGDFVLSPAHIKRTAKVLKGDRRKKCERVHRLMFRAA
jgi:hypothetical protein